MGEKEIKNLVIYTKNGLYQKFKKLGVLDDVIRMTSFLDDVKKNLKLIEMSIMLGKTEYKKFV